MPCLPGKSPLTPLFTRGNRGETMANKVRWFCTRHYVVGLTDGRTTAVTTLDDVEKHDG